MDDRKRRARSTPSSVKRAKSEHDTNPASPPPLPLSAPRGVERIRLPPSLNVKRLPAKHLEQLASERTQVLRGQGRHVVGLPVVLDDGIVLNWYSPDHAPPLPLIVSNRVCCKADAIPQPTKRESGSTPLPTVPAGRRSGASAADAILIASDEDTSGVSSPSSTAVPRGRSVNRDVSPDRDVIDYSDSDAELPSLVCSGSRVEVDGEAPSCPPFLPLARESSLEDVHATTSDPLPNRALAEQDTAVRLSRLRSGDADLTVSGLESDGADEEVNEVEDIDSRISARHVKPPPLSSLRPIRNLLARRQPRGDPDRDVLPGETAVSSQVSQKRGRKEVSEKDPAATSDEGDEDSEFQAADLQYKRVPLPKTNHGRARRLLVPDAVDLPLVAVTMRGDCHFIERRGKYRITGHSLPNPGVFRHVADVCMVGSTAVLGCDRGTDQISFVSVAGKPQMTSVACSPHSSGPRYQDTRRGVSCLAAIHAKGGHIKFLSGGYDGTIHEWMTRVEKLDEPRSRRVASLGACIMALAYRDRDSSIMASAQRRLHVTDLNRCTTSVHPFSNDIQQIHIHPQAAYVTLLEVRHLDRQIQLYDGRKANFDGEPCLSFGYRNASSKFPATHARGSVHLVHFAKANDDGCVLLWDFRNSKRAVVERRLEPAEQVVHTIFADRDIAAFGQGVVTFFEDYLAR